MKGLLYQRSSKSKLMPSWTENYFVLNNTTLVCYAKEGDKQSQNIIGFHPNCTVSEVEFYKRKAHRPLYTFTIVRPLSKDDARPASIIQLGSESKQDAMGWKEAIERAIFRSSADTKVQKSIRTKSPGAISLVSTAMETAMGLFDGKWKVVTFFGGLQIWKESLRNGPESATRATFESLNSILNSTLAAPIVCSIAFAIGGAGIIGTVFSAGIGFIVAFLYYSGPLVTDKVAAFKIAKVISASSSEIFDCIMSDDKRPLWDSSVSECRVIQKLDANSDILHVKFNPVWIWPIWIPPRDLCLLRYWRLEPDESYVICYQSTLHPECHPTSAYVRAICNGGGFTIAPKSTSRTSDMPSSLVTHVVHIDPRGWIKHIMLRFNLLFEYAKNQLLSVIGLEDTLESCRFVPVSLSTTDLPSTKEALLSPTDFDTGAETKEEELLPCTLPRHMWCEPEPASMLVRGPDYLMDHRKVPSAPCGFKLVAVDIFETEGPYEHIASHPENLVQSEIKKYAAMDEEMPFTFVVNFIVPGRVHLSVVLYYRPRTSTVLSEHTPFAELMAEFLEADDSYRDERFKLIPCIVQGPFIVRQAVGSTPALIGKKLRQPYHRGKQYFELDVDICSSMVANRVTGLVLGYTKKLVIDMGFLIQAQLPDELPERLLGSVRLKHLDLSLAKKLAKA